MSVSVGIVFHRAFAYSSLLSENAHPQNSGEYGDPQIFSPQSSTIDSSYSIVQLVMIFLFSTGSVFDDAWKRGYNSLYCRISRPIS